MESNESSNEVENPMTEKVISTEVMSHQQPEESSKIMDSVSEAKDTIGTYIQSPDTPLESTYTPHDNKKTDHANDYSLVFDDIDTVHQELLESITKAKQVHDGLRKRTEILKDKIEKKQNEKEILKQNIQKFLGHQDDESILSINDEINENYLDVKEKECNQIIQHAEKISSNILSDFEHCLPLVDALDQEIGLLRARMKYIKTLKELDANMQLYKELTKREEEVGKRFQTLAEIFRLGISK